MRSEAHAEALPADPQQPQGDPHVADQTGQPNRIGFWPIDEPFPSVLHDIDFIRALGVSNPHFYRRKAKREFVCFELESPYAGRTEYSGHLVAEWLRTGDRPRRFFKGAVRAAAVVRTGKSGRPRKLCSVT